VFRSTREEQGVALRVPACAADSKFSEVIFSPSFSPLLVVSLLLDILLLGDAEVAAHEAKSWMLWMQRSCHGCLEHWLFFLT
jgi:hypothetical protein